MRIALTIAALCAVCLTACVSPCGLKLQQRIERDVEVPCCGGFAHRDLDLRQVEDVEIDILITAAGSGIHGFLTDASCDRLFDMYSGTPNGARCTIYIGPVATGTVSQRRKMSRGQYRLIAQAWTSNQSSVRGSLEMGIFSDDCRWTPISP